MNDEIQKAVKVVIGLKNVAGGFLCPWSDEFRAAAQTVELRETTGLKWKFGYFGEGSPAFYVDKLDGSAARDLATSFNQVVGDKDKFKVTGPYSRHFGDDYYQLRVYAFDYTKPNGKFEGFVGQLGRAPSGR